MTSVAFVMLVVVVIVMGCLYYGEMNYEEDEQ